MRQHTCSNLLLLALPLLFVGVSVAQPPERSPDSEGGRTSGPTPDMFMRSMPVLAALDANKDGVISKEEISNATKALQALDRNKDGELTEQEMRPDFSAMRGRSGRPSEFGGRGGFGRSPQGGRPEGGRGGARPGGENSNLDRMKQIQDVMFEQRDTNKDGKLGRDEMPEQMAGRLEQIDTNDDGSVSRSEMEAMMSRMGNRRGMQSRRPASSRGAGGDPSGTSREGGDLSQRPTSE